VIVQIVKTTVVSADGCLCRTNQVYFNLVNWNEI